VRPPCCILNKASYLWQITFSVLNLLKLKGQWEFPCSWWITWFLCKKLSFWLTETRPEVQLKDFHTLIEIGHIIPHCRKNMENRHMCEWNLRRIKKICDKDNQNSPQNSDCKSIPIYGSQTQGYLNWFWIPYTLLVKETWSRNLWGVSFLMGKYSVKSYVNLQDMVLMPLQSHFCSQKWQMIIIKIKLFIIVCN
jgi:hypothetical protein